METHIDLEPTSHVPSSTLAGADGSSEAPFVEGKSSAGISDMEHFSSIYCIEPAVDELLEHQSPSSPSSISGVYLLSEIASVVDSAGSGSDWQTVPLASMSDKETMSLVDAPSQVEGEYTPPYTSVTMC